MLPRAYTIRDADTTLDVGWREALHHHLVYIYQTRARMIHAMKLLADPLADITVVAQGCGFANVHAFAAAFRGFTHETPAQYRARFA